MEACLSSRYLSALRGRLSMGAQGTTMPAGWITVRSPIPAQDSYEINTKPIISINTVTNNNELQTHLIQNNAYFVINIAICIATSEYKESIMKTLIFQRCGVIITLSIIFTILTTDTLQLTNNGELWVVFCELNNVQSRVRECWVQYDVIQDHVIKAFDSYTVCPAK